MLKRAPQMLKKLTQESSQIVAILKNTSHALTDVSQSLAILKDSSQIVTILKNTLQILEDSSQPMTAMNVFFFKLDGFFTNIDHPEGFHAKC